MKHRGYDAVVVGAGSAGMAAALSVREQGFEVAMIEREPFLGGILMQCIHSGFGIHHYGEDLTGPEYAERSIRRIMGSGIDVFLDTTIMDIGTEGNAHSLVACSTRHGVAAFEARSVVLAMGCRERNRGSVAIAGTRPAGIFTAGLAQRLVNIEGYIPGRRVVIVGSGDIGLIMARRLALVGCEVLGVVEIQPYPSGLVRNIVQCLNDFSIPLHLGHVVSRIFGADRVQAVEVTPLRDGAPDYSKSFRLECDTILLSVGLVPENELSRKAHVTINEEVGGPYVDADLMTSVPGIFACGNVLHVHDLVDFASEEAQRCGASICEFLRGAPSPARGCPIRPGANVRYVIPNQYAHGRPNVLYLRSLVVKNDAMLEIKVNGRTVKSRKLAHVQPSEMIRIDLAASDLAGIELDPSPLMEVSVR